MSTSSQGLLGGSPPLLNWWPAPCCRPREAHVGLRQGCAERSAPGSRFPAATARSLRYSFSCNTASAAWSRGSSANGPVSEVPAQLRRAAVSPWRGRRLAAAGPAQLQVLTALAVRVDCALREHRDGRPSRMHVLEDCRRSLYGGGVCAPCGHGSVGGGGPF